MRPDGNVRLALVAIGIALVASGYAQAQSSVAKPDGASAVSPERALEVQGEIQRARLPQRLEAALGDGFGGVWYEQRTAQLHVGIVSVLARVAAETVAAESGLAAVVTPTPVRSTLPALRAEQEHLFHRLSDLFGQAEVSTGLLPQRNAVNVELASSVPAARRSAVKAEAGTAGVNVLVDLATSRRLQIHQQACKPFVNKEALCDPPIVAGVSIASKKSECTAGPAVILEKPGKPAEAEETFLLTAGHCASTIGEKWSAFTTATPPVEKELGPVVESLFPETDIGVIKIEKGSYWLNPQPVPVNPTVAPWNEAKPIPFPVFVEAPPVPGNKTCFSGQTSGTECGVVEEIGVELEWEKGKVTKELAKVKGALAFKGDSGAPWFSEASPGVIEGTHVGQDSKAQPLFQPLEVSLAKLKTKYELLTVTNQARDLGDFVSEVSETVVTSTADGTGKTAHHVIELDSGVLTCSSASFEGTQSGEEAIELTITPTYKECLFSGSPVTVSTGGCAYGLHSSREFEIKSRAGKNCATEPIKVEFAACKIEIPPQAERASLNFHNIKPGAVEEVTMETSLTGISYKATGAGCPKAGEFSDGTYSTGNTILTGAKPGGGAMVNYRWEE